MSCCSRSRSIRLSVLPSIAALTAVVSLAAASPAPATKPVYDYGPPLNRATLPWEILGLAGGYVITVATLLGLLFTLGRRLRRHAQMSTGLDIEMVKAKPKPITVNQAFEPTPISPASTTRSWFKSPFKKTPSVRSGEISNPCSPGIQSVTSFDDGRIQADKEDRAKEMERLYAAVMAHEDEKEARKSAAHSTVSISEFRPASQHTQRDLKSPLRINTAEASADRFPEPQSATSLRSPYRGIYPPHSARSGKFDYDMPGDHMPVQQYANMAPKDPRVEALASPGSSRMPLSPRNFLSRSSRPPSSSSNSSSKTRKALKNLRISAPVQKYPGDADDEEARTPLSPRIYNPPPPPLPPSQANTPGTANTMDSSYAHEMRDEPKPLPMPRPAPQRLNLVPPPAISSPGPKSAGSSTSSLPFRAYQTDASPAVPPTPTKTTYVEHRKEKLSLMTPRTGVVPQTPYSPYMPYTPITPVSARLVTRQERKQLKKAAGKRMLTEDDLVKEEDDMWNGGY